MHQPRRELYPTLEKFKYTNHEYYRYHKAYLKSYNEEELVRIFADAALAYDDKTMGNFSVSFRCYDSNLLTHVIETLRTKGKISDIISRAKEKAAQTNKKAAKLLDRELKCWWPDTQTGVVTYCFVAPNKKVKSKKEK